MGHDRSKDQSYFLFSLDQHQLAAARFPLGEMTKDVVRAQAAERGFINAGKGDSQDLCFVGDEGVAGFSTRPTARFICTVPLNSPMALSSANMTAWPPTPSANARYRRRLTEPIYVVDIDISRSAR